MPINAAIKLDQSSWQSSDLRETEEADHSVQASSCNDELLGLLLSTAGCAHAYNPDTDARIDLDGSTTCIDICIAISTFMISVGPTSLANYVYLSEAGRDMNAGQCRWLNY